MSTRRDFLRRTSLALAGGLIVGDAALELFERLTHRPVFASAWPSAAMDSARYRQLHAQLKYQAGKAVESFARSFGTQIYGVSPGERVFRADLLADARLHPLDSGPSGLYCTATTDDQRALSNHGASDV